MQKKTIRKKAIRKITKEEKIIKLLSYLKKYTDKDNPASIPMIERYFSTNYCKYFFGDKNTRKYSFMDGRGIIKRRDTKDLVFQIRNSVPHVDPSIRLLTKYNTAKGDT